MIPDTIPAPPLTAAESVASEEHTGLDLIGELSRLRVALQVTEEERKDRAIECGILRVDVENLKRDNEDLRARVVWLMKDLAATVDERDAANVAAGRMRIELENLKRDTTRAA